MWKPFKIFEENETQHVNTCHQTSCKRNHALYIKMTNIKNKVKPFVLKIKRTVQAHTGVTCSYHVIQYCCNYSNKRLLVNITA